MPDAPAPATHANLGILAGKTIAFLVASGFSETAYSSLQRALVKLGARGLTVAPDSGLVNGWQEGTVTEAGVQLAGDWGHYHPVDRQLGETLAADLDALAIPGGSRSLAKLKANLHVKRILSHAIDAGKPVLLFGDARELTADRGATPDNVATLDATTDEAWVEGALAHLANQLARSQADAQAA